MDSSIKVEGRQVDDQMDSSTKSNGKQVGPSTRSKGRKKDNSKKNSCKCPECDKIFATELRVKRHVWLIHQGGYKTYKKKICEVCGKSFKDLKLHMLSHTGTRNFHCQICDKSFIQKSTLQCHMRTHTGEKPYECPICSMRFAQTSNVKRHLKVHEKQVAKSLSKDASSLDDSSPNVDQEKTDSPKPVKPRAPKHKTKFCDRCGKYVTNFEQHLLTHDRTLGVQCPVCNKSFTQAYYLTIHMRYHTGERPFSCPKCPKKFTNASLRNLHLKSHEEGGAKNKNKTYCDACGKFVSQYWRHIRTHQGIKPYKCQVCDKKFGDASYLRIHLLTHSGEKPFKCPVCPKRFVRSGRRKDHMKTRHGLTPESFEEQSKTNSDDWHYCIVCCKRFKTKLTLDDHKCVKENFKCDICHVGFHKYRVFQQHKCIQASNESIPCHICGVQCDGKSLLEQHIKYCHEHDTKKKFSCAICSEKFLNQGVLKRHMRTHEKEQNNECNSLNKFVSDLNEDTTNSESSIIYIMLENEHFEETSDERKSTEICTTITNEVLENAEGNQMEILTGLPNVSVEYCQVTDNQLETFLTNDNSEDMSDNETADDIPANESVDKISTADNTLVNDKLSATLETLPLIQSPNMSPENNFQESEGNTNKQFMQLAYDKTAIEHLEDLQSSIKVSTEKNQTNSYEQENINMKSHGTQAVDSIKKNNERKTETCKRSKETQVHTRAEDKFCGLDCRTDNVSDTTGTYMGSSYKANTCDVVACLKALINSDSTQEMDMNEAESTGISMNHTMREAILEIRDYVNTLKQAENEDICVKEGQCCLHKTRVVTSQESIKPLDGQNIDYQMSIKIESQDIGIPDQGASQNMVGDQELASLNEGAPQNMTGFNVMDIVQEVTDSLSKQEVGGGGDKEGSLRKSPRKTPRRMSVMERQYECHICKMLFVVNADLKKHLRTHTGDKPFSCDLCNKSFAQIGNLNVHKRTHTKDLPYQCEFCDHKFNHKSNLKCHIAKRHPDFSSLTIISSLDDPSVNVIELPDHDQS